MPSASSLLKAALLIQSAAGTTDETIINSVLEMLPWAVSRKQESGQSYVTLRFLPPETPHAKDFLAMTCTPAPEEYADYDGLIVFNEKTQALTFLPHEALEALDVLHPRPDDGRSGLVLPCAPDASDVPKILGSIADILKPALSAPTPGLAPPPVLSDTPPSQQPSGVTMLEDDRIITKEGSRYFPVSLAAQVAQAPRTTLVDWIKAKIKFNGRPLQTYNSPTARKLYLTEESVQRAADRFIKWPSKESAGPVTLGEKRDQSGYIGLPKAARALGVDYHTLWLWSTQGKAAPTDKPLDVIQCTASEQFYIRQKDVAQLKRLIPRSGLPRGRRPQLDMSPS